MQKQIGLLGSGGHAEEVTASYEGAVIFRAVSKKYVDSKASVDIEHPSTEEMAVPVHAAIGAPKIRRDLIQLWPGNQFETVIARTAVVDTSAHIGAGCYIAEGAVITTNVTIDKHVIVNVGSSVHHNCTMGEYTTISPGVHIGGNTIIGQGVFIGIGATVNNGVKIADGVVLGAGAVLVTDADTENGVYVGVPAKLIKVNKGWLSEL